MTAKIGVLAYDGKPQAVARWQPTADYLATNIPGHEFQVEALSHEEFKHELNKGSLDFILTNPGHYVRLESAYGATRIATFKASFKNQELTRFSSVIFAAKESDIKHISDLPSRRFAAVSQDAFGGFQLAQKALHEEGVNALEELDILWLGFPHSDVVKAVLEGKAEAGTVRTGILENMVEKQELELSKLIILAKKETAGFPLLHSVDLHPEWPFATLPETDPSLAREVAVALLQMADTDAPAKSAGGRGWTIPLDYTSVHEVFRALEIDPYLPVDIGIIALWQRYWLWLIIVAFLLTLTLLALFRLIHANRQLTQTQEALVDQQAQLENKVTQRTRQLSELNDRLKADVAIRAQSEHNLASGCKTMQALYRISMRDDLDHAQRLQSILDLARQYMDSEFAMLSGLNEERFEQCKISPAQKSLQAPLDPVQSRRAIKQNQLVISENQGNWRTYLANPIYVDGKLRCLLEFSTSSKYPPTDWHSDRELKLQVLKLISQWLGNEITQLESQTRSEAQYEKIRERFTDISPREKQVLALLVNGESSKSAANILDISSKTVELHRANLLRKTHAKSSAELVKLAVLLEERLQT